MLQQLIVATTYTVTGIDVNGCANIDSVSVSLIGNPITPGPDATICRGNSTALSVSGSASYVWHPGVLLNDSTIANPVAAPPTSTTFTVIGTAATGCRDTAFVTVTVNQLPNVIPGASLAICAGSSANLSVTGADTYVWSPASSLNTPNGPNPIATPTTTTTYTVVGTDINGCSSSNTAVVNVSPLPAANAGTNVSICNGSSTTLSATGGGTYSWSPATGLSSTTIANPVASPSTTTTYTVTVTGPTFCTATSVVTVTVNSIPVANAGADPAAICNGQSVVLNGSGGATYSWSPSAGLSDPSIANPTASPSATTQYTLTVSNASGCTSTDVVQVSISNSITIPSPVVTSETCSNGNGTIAAGPISGGNPPYTYSIGGAFQSAPAFTSLSSGTYTLTVSDNIGCIGTVPLTVGQQSNITASFTADPSSGPKPLNVTFSNTSTSPGGTLTYIWDLGNGTTSTAANPSTTYLQAGTYTVTLEASNGGAPCIDVASLTVVVTEEAVFVIPNVFTPNGDGNNDRFVITSQGVDRIEGEIFNRWGKRIYEWSGDENSGWDGKINGKPADDGTYYYILDVRGTDGKTTPQKGYVELFGN
jgi:gliding motility-associated-like protein